MSTNFPGSVDSFTSKGDNVDIVHASDIDNLQDAVVAIENAVKGTPAAQIPLSAVNGSVSAVGGGAAANTAAFSPSLTITSSYSQTQEAIDAFAIFNSTDTTGSSLYAIRAQSQNLGTGTVNHAIGLKVNGPINTGGGTVNNIYQAYLAAPTTNFTPASAGSHLHLEHIEGTPDPGHSGITWGPGSNTTFRLSANSDTQLRWGFPNNGGLIFATGADSNSASFGNLSLGAGAFDGSSGGHFVGSSAGNVLAINAGSGFTGWLIGAQVQGADVWHLSNLGKITQSPQANTVAAEQNSFAQGVFTLTVSATYATQRFNWWRQPTITAGTAQTVTTAATMAVEGAPAASGSATITNAWSLWSQAGQVAIDGGFTTSANYGQLSVGQVWDGSSTGHFVGSGSGTEIAVNAPSGYGGDLMRLEVAGTTEFFVNASGMSVSFGGARISGGPGSGSAGTLTFTNTTGIGNSTSTNLTAPALGTGSGPTSLAVATWYRVWDGTSAGWIPVMH